MTELFLLEDIIINLKTLDNNQKIFKNLWANR